MLDMPFCTNNVRSHEVVVLEKAGVFSVLAMSSAVNGLVVIGRTDPRSLPPVNQSRQDSIESGRVNFENSVRHSQDNGWRIVWRGHPYGVNCN